MNHLNREVNGSGRILFRTARHTCVPSWEATAQHYTLGVFPPAKVEVKYGEIQEGFITEWASSGKYVRIRETWYKADEVELLEVLAEQAGK